MSIESIAVALPSIRQTAKDIAEATGADVDFIVDKIGLKERYILGPEESGVTLSTKACELLFEKNPELRGSIDLVACVTQTPDQRIPHNSARVAAALKLPNDVATFDISLGCSGYVYGLQIVKGFLIANGMRNAVLVTCDPYSRIMAAEDKDTNCLFGDAATATWIRSDAGRSRTLAAVFGSDGASGDAIRLPVGGARSPFVSVLEKETKVFGRNDLRLHMQGRSVFNFVMTRIPESIAACLERAKLSLADIDFFALHQGSSYMLDALARRAQLPDGKLLKNMDRFGNTVSSSVPMLLSELDRDGRLDGAVILLSGFGVGLSWATAIIKFQTNGQAVGGRQ